MRSKHAGRLARKRPHSSNPARWLRILGRTGLLAFLTCSMASFGSAQEPPAPTYESPPVLSAGVILRPEYDQGPNFHVRDPVPTYAGANNFTIDSDFGVFQAEGNDVLMRRVREIQAIAQLRTMSGTQDFARAAEKAAASPLVAARDLVTNPVGTISGVPRGIWKFLNRAGEQIKELGESNRPQPGGLAGNLLGFSKVKRTIALNLGVDPYSSNEVFQRELNKVAWPAFAGGFVVNVGMAAVTGGAGIALNSAKWTDRLNDILRDNNPTDLRLMNAGILQNMGVSRDVADAYLNNNAVSPSVQTITIAALAQLEGASGRDRFLIQATSSADEADALFYQQCAQLMAMINATLPIVLISPIEGLPVCQAADGTVVVPLQWDYVAWTQGAASFVTALKAAQFAQPATGYLLAITGVVSPMAGEALGALGVRALQKQLMNPLK